MNAKFQHQLSAVDRPLALRARRDVQPVSVAFAGQAAYVLKDPLTLEMFHLSAEDFFLFEALQQSLSLSELQKEFERRFAPRRITAQELQHGLNQLHEQGLLLSEASGQGGELRERADRRRRSERWQSLLKLLSFRLGSIDATRIVDGLHHRLRWLFSLPMLGIAIALCAYAASILLGHGSEMIARLPSLVELAQPRYWLLWIATIAIVKVLHELAHAVTCKHFGARCHEMGVLLLAMIPCLYCDVTDVWRLPSKWHRMAVSAAGMFVELVVAAVALIAWWHLQPGLLQTWCLSLVMVCSVGTLLVNANPLLRYDGYYILSDLVEVPNLAGRAQSLMPGGLRRWLLAEPRTEDPLLSPRRRQGVWIYAISARIYLTLVLLGIFVVLLAWTRPYHLENLVYTLGVLTMLGMIFSPLAAVWRLLRNPSLRMRLRLPRLAFLALAVSALLTAAFYWPITRSITGSAVFVPAEGQPLYATTAGTLRQAVAAGSRVQEGDVLFRLENPQSQLALARQQGEYEVRQVHFQQLGTMRSWDDQSAQKLPTARAALQDASAQLKQLETKAEELLIRAPRDGVVVAPPKIFLTEQDKSRLGTWTGSPLDARNVGCWIEPGTLLATVSNVDRLELLVAIDQADVAEVRPGQTVRILLESSPVRVLTGQVAQVARRSEKRTTVDPAIATEKYHLVEVDLDAQDAQLDAHLLVGTRARAKIEARRTTLSKIVANQLRQSLRLAW